MQSNLLTVTFSSYFFPIHVVSNPLAVAFKLAPVESLPQKSPGAEALRNAKKGEINNKKIKNKILQGHQNDTCFFFYSAWLNVAIFHWSLNHVDWNGVRILQMVLDDPTPRCTKTTCGLSEDAPSSLLGCALPVSREPSESASKVEPWARSDITVSKTAGWVFFGGGGMGGHFCWNWIVVSDPWCGSQK